MIVKLVVLILCMVGQAFQATPLMDNLNAPDMATEDLISFRKVDSHYWSSIISAFPMKKNATTEVTIKLISGNTIFIGIGAKNTNLLNSQHWGWIPNTYGFYAQNGEKYFNGNAIDYGVACVVGDRIKMRVDLH